MYKKETNVVEKYELIREKNKLSSYWGDIISIK